MRKFLKSFVYAAKGIVYSLRGRNMRIHICAALFVMYFALKFYSLSRGELALLILTVSAVISLEAANTAIECLADYAAKSTHPLIAHCKDCAAGAVLIAAAGSVFIGIALLWDTEVFREIFEYYSVDAARIIPAALSVIGALCFIIVPEILHKKNNPQR